MFSDQADIRAAPPGAIEQMQMPALAVGHLHEIHAHAGALAAATAFALTAIAPNQRKPILLARVPHRAALRMQPYGEGLAGLGIDPARLLIVEARDNLGMLRAGLDAARCPGLAAVVMETWGTLREYDLTASRRLVLGAERSRVPVIMLRGEGIANLRAEPRASAAHSRWRIACAPSIPLAARAPGPPAIEVELLRQRGGRAGLRWRLTWDDEHGCFREDRPGSAMPGDTERRHAALSGAVVPLARLRAGPAPDHAIRAA
jgi:protein ImuA